MLSALSASSNTYSNTTTLYGLGAKEASSTTPAENTGEQSTQTNSTSTSKGAKSGQTDSTGKTLSPRDQERVKELAETDRKVRAHEAAHLAAAGGLAASGASYTYAQGPDGKRYAVGGEVQISLGKGSTPQETISNAEQVRRAALAPADPSGQDQQVAAEASQMISEARAQMASQALKTGYSSKTPKGGLVNTQA